MFEPQEKLIPIVKKVGIVDMNSLKSKIAEVELVFKSNKNLNELNKRRKEVYSKKKNKGNELEEKERINKSRIEAKSEIHRIFRDSGVELYNIEFLDCFKDIKTVLKRYPEINETNCNKRELMCFLNSLGYADYDDFIKFFKNLLEFPKPLGDMKGSSAENFKKVIVQKYELPKSYCNVAKVNMDNIDYKVKVVDIKKFNFGEDAKSGNSPATSQEATQSKQEEENAEKENLQPQDNKKKKIVDEDGFELISKRNSFKVIDPKKRKISKEIQDYLENATKFNLLKDLKKIREEVIQEMESKFNEFGDNYLNSSLYKDMFVILKKLDRFQDMEFEEPDYKKKDLLLKEYTEIVKNDFSSVIFDYSVHKLNRIKKAKQKASMVMSSSASKMFRCFEKCVGVTEDKKSAEIKKKKIQNKIKRSDLEKIVNNQFEEAIIKTTDLNPLVCSLKEVISDMSLYCPEPPVKFKFNGKLSRDFKIFIKKKKGEINRNDLLQWGIHCDLISSNGDELIRMFGGESTYKKYERMLKKIRIYNQKKEYLELVI